MVPSVGSTNNTRPSTWPTTIACGVAHKVLGTGIEGIGEDSADATPAGHVQQDHAAVRAERGKGRTVS